MAEEHGQIRDEQLDAEREARRRLALAQIRQYPDPALRMQARPVESFDEDLRRLVERMASLMIDRTTPEARREAMAALRPRLVLR